MVRNERFSAAAAVTLFTALLVMPGAAQQVADPGFKSVGRGAPVAGALPALTLPLGPQGGPPNPEALPLNVPINSAQKKPHKLMYHYMDLQ
jgi:hypothetical protein